MASLQELLANFKTLMHTYFMYTTEIETALEGKSDTTHTHSNYSAVDHGHGNVENDGKIKISGTAQASKNVVTDASGNITAEDKLTGSSTATDIKMNGTQSAGSSSQYAKADHVHPIDTSRAPSSHTHDDRYYTESEIVAANVTKLTSNNYNVDIDGTCVITCTLTDIFGNPKAGQNVTVDCDKGYFTKYNDTDISGTSTTSKTGTTDSNGQFTLTYKASEWGLVTFSTNNHNTQIQVKGWKQVDSYLNEKIKMYSDGEFINLTIDGSITASAWNSITTIDSRYAPPMTLSGVYHHSAGPDTANKLIIIGSNGNISCNSALNNTNCKTNILYRL